MTNGSHANSPCSFLDEDRNTDLIRWSEKGDSFIVLDEDEFAKSLIPELFKHNNYASFVRQLNMYGFHKRVGLSDNSMKASERKNKSPSEYHNPYFRRGHPNLLWLINKPKSSSSKKKQGGKKDEGDVDSDDDNVVDEVFVPPVATAPIGRAPSTASDLGPLQKKDLVQVKSQLDRLQQQQTTISNVLGKLRAEHATLYKQAVMFQNMHERHENSINAILNFLANVFRKSLEEQGGAHTIQDLFSSILPNAQAHGQPQMPQGNIIDLDDYVSRPAQNTPAISTPKRPQRLLPPIPHQQAGKANTLSPSATPSPAPLTSGYQGHRMGSVTEVFDASPADTASPAFIKDELRTNPQEGMMKIIHDTNAVNTSGIDLPNIAAHASIRRMDDDQRSKMLSMMAGQSSASTPANGAAQATAGPSAGIPSTPDIPMSSTPGLSLSPVLGSIPPPPLRNFEATQSELEALQQLQNNQANQISQLSSILGPLSPSGRIPGLDSEANPNAGYFGDIDYDQFLNATAYNDPAFDTSFGGVGTAVNTDGNDFNFSLDGNASMAGADDLSGYIPVSNNAGQGPVSGFDMGSVGGALFETASAGTPSEAGTEEIPRNDLEIPDRDPKRRRKG